MDRLEALSDTTPESIAAFAEAHGYVLLRGLIDVKLLRALARTVEEAWSAADGDSVALHRIVLPTPELDRVRRDPSLLSALNPILGDCDAEQGDVIRVVEPGDPPTPPHRDASYVGVERRIWSAWIPLEDCPLAQGPLAVWPGSHLLGLVHDFDEARWAADDLSSGDVLLLSALTAHKALPNRANRPRLSIDCRYASRRA